MDRKEIFAQLLRYFPEGDNAKIYLNMVNYSLVCLSVGDFAEAEKYADTIIVQDSNKSRLVSARMVKLYAKLGCCNDTEFCHSKEFNEDMPEYEELLAVCSDNEGKLTKLLNLVKRRRETIAEDKRKSEEAERRRQAAEYHRREAEAERLRREEERRQREARLEEERKAEISRRQKEQSKEKFLNVVFALIFIVLPTIGLMAIIAILVSVSDEITRNGAAAALAFVVFILTGVAGAIGAHIDHPVLKVAYIPFGITCLLILVIGIMSC